MRLFEHEDFPQAILRTAAELGVSEQFVEKDYYVTEILRIVAAELGEKAMFKGGTSLSKGWGLITRFSEDIDLFVNPDSFDPRPGKNKLDRILKELSVSVEKHPALAWLKDECDTIGGLGRSDLFAYRVAIRHAAWHSRRGSLRARHPERQLSERGRIRSPRWSARISLNTVPGCSRTPTIFTVSRCRCCTSAAPSSRRCSPSTAR